MSLVQKHKKSGSVKYTVLYQIRVYVEMTGVRTAHLKFAVKPTSQQYLPMTITDEMEKEHTEHKLSPAYERIKFNRLMKVERLFSYDEPSKIARAIFYLEGHQEEAVNKLRTELDTYIATLKKSVDLVYEAWTTRKEQKTK